MKNNREQLRVAGRHNLSAFTLIELMTVVTVVGILASFAYPSYTGYVTRANRSIAKSMLQQVAGREEQYFQDNKLYINDMTSLGYPSNPFCVDGNSNVVDCMSTNRVYTFSISTTGTPALAFTVTATPQFIQASRDTHCGNLTTTEQTTRGAAASDCW